MSWLKVAVCALPLALAGCRTPVVDTVILNRGPAIRLLEFDYPYASFGADSLAAGAQFHYRFTIQGSGPLTFQFQDAAGKSHQSNGPQVDKGEEGSLSLSIDAGGHVTWLSKLAQVR